MYCQRIDILPKNLCTAKEFIYCQRIYVLPKNLCTAKECIYCQRVCVLPEIYILPKDVIFTTTNGCFTVLEVFHTSQGRPDLGPHNTFSVSLGMRMSSEKVCILFNKANRDLCNLLGTQINERLRQISYIVTKTKPIRRVKLVQYHGGSVNVTRE